jgi:hypothetical protein
LKKKLSFSPKAHLEAMVSPSSYAKRGGPAASGFGGAASAGGTAEHHRQLLQQDQRRRLYDDDDDAGCSCPLAKYALAAVVLAATGYIIFITLG